MVYLDHIITIFNNFNTDNIDALKRYESTEVARKTWLHVPRVPTGPTEVTFNK